MRLLPALVLTHYLGCVFPEDSDDERDFRKLYKLRTRENTLKLNSSIWTSASISKRIYDNRVGNFSSVKLRSVQKYRGNNRRNIRYDYYEPGQSGPSYLHPHSFAFEFKKYGHVQELVPQWNKETQHIHICHQDLHYFNLFKNRRLLSYSGESVVKNSVKSEQLHSTPLRKKEQSDPLKENRSEMWDDWGNWSKCSVSCGNGRKVRWRHCLVDDCTKGLKKAQIKTCRLKECDSKNILHWLGIKTR